MRKFTFFTLLVCSICLCVPAGAAVILTPSNVQIPGSPGEIFSFDFVISDDDGVTAATFQSTISIGDPCALTFDDISSEAVSSELDYWVHYWRPNNSAGIITTDHGDDSYTFADNPDQSDPCDPLNYAVPLDVDDIMARYAFEWDGTVGDYTITLDLDASKTYILNGITYNMDALTFDRGQYPGDSSSFSVNIPEPTTLILFGLAGTILLRKRRV